MSKPVIGVLNVSDRARPPVFPAIPYGIDLIGGPRLETNDAVMKAFRPKGG